MFCLEVGGTISCQTWNFAKGLYNRCWVMYQMIEIDFPEGLTM